MPWVEGGACSSKPRREVYVPRVISNHNQPPVLNSSEGVLAAFSIPEYRNRIAQSAGAHICVLKAKLRICKCTRGQRDKHASKHSRTISKFQSTRRNFHRGVGVTEILVVLIVDGNDTVTPRIE